MSLKELGHPHMPKFEWLWNSPGNPNNCIAKAKRSVRLANKDNFNVVLREEDQPQTQLGLI
jgi:predicted phosphodiesterase